MGKGGRSQQQDKSDDPRKEAGAEAEAAEINGRLFRLSESTGDRSIDRSIDLLRKKRAADFLSTLHVYLGTLRRKLSIS